MINPLGITSPIHLLSTHYYLSGDRVLEINARRMEGLSRTDAIEWFKVCDKATLVLERFVEAPTPSTNPQQQMTQPASQSQLSSFEGVRF